MKKIVLCIAAIILSSCSSTGVSSRSVAEVTRTEEAAGGEQTTSSQVGVLEYLDCKRLDNPAGKYGLFRNYKRISDNYELENIGFGVIFNTPADCAKELRKVYLEDQKNNCRNN